MFMIADKSEATICTLKVYLFKLCSAAGLFGVKRRGGIKSIVVL